MPTDPVNRYAGYLHHVQGFPAYPAELERLLPAGRILTADADTLIGTIFSWNRTVPLPVTVPAPQGWVPSAKPLVEVRLHSPLQILQRHLARLRHQAEYLRGEARLMPQSTRGQKLVRSKGVGQAAIMRGAAHRALRYAQKLESGWEREGLRHRQVVVARAVMLPPFLAERARATINAASLVGLSPAETYLAYLQDVYKALAGRGPQFRNAAGRLGLMPSAAIKLTLGALVMISITLPTA